MENDGKQFITDKKPELMELTNCSVQFLAIMEQEKLLSKMEKQEIDGIVRSKNSI